LYEAHLPVVDTTSSQDFYSRVAGLQFAYRDPSRDIVFLWAGKQRRSMVGLWGPTTTYGRDFRRSHVAFAMSFPELLAAAEHLRKNDIRSYNFAGEQTSEPSVIGWMPSAQIYFDDPDGHCLEFIALLDEKPQPGFIGRLSEWRD
jgi:lactoylglutathione lyase